MQRKCGKSTILLGDVQHILLILLIYYSNSFFGETKVLKKIKL